MHSSREVGVGLDALAVVRLHEQLDVAGQRQHRPGALAEHGARHVVRLGVERVAARHLSRDQRLDAAEQLLVLDLLVGEAHQCLERDLVAERSGGRLISSTLALMKRSTRPKM